MSGSYDNANPPHVWETPQHECARIGCTRRTSEQECDLHAAEPAGVIHEPKEPRRAPTREEFEENVRRIIHGTVGASTSDLAHPLLAAYDDLAAERDEWKRRAEEEGGLARKAESLAARKLVDYAALDIEMDEIAVALGYAEEHEGHVMRAPQATLLRVIGENARARGEAEDERDIAVRLVEDPRVKAWCALTEEQRSYRVEDLRTWADMVEAGAAPDGADHGPSPLRIAAAALEALAEE